MFDRTVLLSISEATPTYDRVNQDHVVKPAASRLWLPVFVSRKRLSIDRASRGKVCCLELTLRQHPTAAQSRYDPLADSTASPSRDVPPSGSLSRPKY